MSSVERIATAPPEPKPDPVFWLIQRTGDNETRMQVGDLAAARTAWLAAIRSGSVTYAAVVGPGKGDLDGWPCEWGHGGQSFQDRTPAHRAEMDALAQSLTAEAPEGYSVTLRDEPGGWRVVFTGSRFGQHTLLGSASAAERVRNHWCGYTSRSEGA